MSIHPWFHISLAQWSLNKSFFANKITNLDFPAISKKQFDIDVVEWVNQFFMDKAEDAKYLNEVIARCKDNGVISHLIMIDNEGSLASTNHEERKTAIENHYKWIDAAKYIGCSSVRVNAFGKGSKDEVLQAAVDGIGEVAGYASGLDINVLLENHGGYTSDGEWMVKLINHVNMPNVGSLPDFGNFCIRSEKGYEWGKTCLEEYDKYKGVTELIPFAKGVSAKVMAFDEEGNCKETDYARMMKIVKDGGFTGYIGIESSVATMEEEEDGVKKTKALLEKFI